MALPCVRATCPACGAWADIFTHPCAHPWETQEERKACGEKKASNKIPKDKITIEVRTESGEIRPSTLDKLIDAIGEDGTIILVPNGKAESGKKSNHIKNPAMVATDWKIEIASSRPKQVSIFSGLSDKEALRAMVDECTKRGLSIMVNMCIEAHDLGLVVAQNMKECIHESNTFNDMRNNGHGNGFIIFPSEKLDNKADEAFAKIMKTIKYYQDGIKS